MNPVLIDNHINSACCITPTLLAYSSPHQCLTGSGESLFYANPCQLRSCGNREYPLIGQIHPGLAVRTELVRVDPADTLSVLFPDHQLLCIMSDFKSTAIFKQIQEGLAGFPENERKSLQKKVC